ncbi:hypothetical protein [Capillimicrobium parvum]|uniref:Uncharacterized protein n=1 Tax=Capillimicrobium parvum TaxID=2884022 RepID=A0A9E6Y461_9ACTN|nr:hypothetical protein [Capillimicrobium parvum]UGS39175.1 hypothetical protein DSM104329_05607 [Capillimicrobium parvum]
MTVVGAANRSESLLVPLIAAWWLLATLYGLWLGRKHETSPPIAKLLADARAATVLPEQRPGLILLNRLWPLLISTIAAGALAFLAPQVAGIACGFAIIWALAWRHQEKAVTAIEERDGVEFFVERTSPFQPIKLVRAQGFRRDIAPVV